MPFIMDKINNPADLGREIRGLRMRLGIRSVQLAKDSGRSRDVLHRLERGERIGNSTA